MCHRCPYLRVYLNSTITCTLLTRQKVNSSADIAIWCVVLFEDYFFKSHLYGRLHTYNYRNVKQCNCMPGNNRICLNKELKLSTTWKKRWFCFFSLWIENWKHHKLYMKLFPWQWKSKISFNTYCLTVWIQKAL